MTGGLWQPRGVEGGCEVFGRFFEKFSDGVVVRLLGLEWEGVPALKSLILRDLGFEVSGVSRG